MAISIKRKENKVNVRVKDTIVKTFANPDDYVLKTDIVDSLDSSATDKPLSANQGAELKKLINISEKYLTAVEVNESGNRLIFTLSDDTTIEADTSAWVYSGDNNTITLDGKTFKVAESITNAIEDLQEDLSNTKESVIDLANSKVDKVSGKGLSTNDFTNADKTAIEDLQAQSGAELNITDENKLQLLNDSGTVVSEVALPTDVQPEEVSLEEAFNTRTTASNGSGTKYEIKDGSIAKVDYICGYSDRSGNLLNIADKAKSTTNGVSCVIKNGVVTLNGTATANTSIYLTDDMELEGTYQLNAFNTNAKASTFYVSIVNMYYVGSNVSATFDTATTTKCYIYYASGTVLNNVVLKPMLVKGKTAPTEFKPYYGVIRHSDTSELVSTGNNLFNIADKASTVINGLTYSVKDNVLTMNGTTTANTDFFFDFEMPKGKYYIKDFGNATADLSFALVLVDGLGNEYSLNTSNGSYGSTVSKVVEVKSDCTRLKVHVNANKTFTNTLVKPMLIRDTTTAPTEYQPYWQETLHIPASVRNLNGYGWGLSLTDKSKTNYIDYKRGKYVQNVASVDLGTLTWTKFTTPEPYNAVQFKAPLTDGIFSISTTIAGEVLCLQYDTVDSNTLWAGSQDEVVNYVRDINSDGTVKVHDTAYDSVDTSTFKTAMSGVILYYLLKTPIETDIDLTELNYKVDNYGTEKLVNTYNSKALVGVTYNADLKEQILANADNITRLDERVEVLENSGSDVEINPSDEATETAEKIKVGDTTYSVKEPNVAVDVNGNVIIGDGATIEPMTGSTITNATVVGKNAKAKQKDSSAKADNSVVIGRNATAESGGNIAIGNISISNGFNGSIAIGWNSRAYTESSIAIGCGASVSQSANQAMQFGRGSNTTYNTAQFGGALSGSNCYVNAIKHYTSNNYYKTALSYGAFTTATDTTIEEGTYEMIVNQTSTDTDYSLGFITFRNKNTKAYFGENNKSWIEISSAGRLLSRGIIASGGTFTQTISGNDTTTDDTNYSFKTTVFVGYEASDMTVAGVDGATATINSYNSVTGNVTLTITGTSAALSATITYTLAGDCTISYRKVSN